MASREVFRAGAAVIGFVLAYALPPYAKLPNLFYDPVGRRFFVSATAGAVPMSYYGLLIYGSVGAAIGFLLATAAVRRDTVGESVHLLWPAWVATSVLIVMAYFAWGNWP